MGALTILFVITTAWFIYHFIRSYTSKKIDKENLLRMFDYGKSIGLFALVTGVLGQMIGFSAMFSAIEEALLGGKDIVPALVYGAIRVTMIVTIYGMLIYLFSLLLWFIASILVEKKFK